MKIYILTETELRKCIRLDMEAVDTIADGFSRLAQGGVDMPPIMRIEVPENNGECDIKTAYVPGFEGFAVKMSSGFFDNHKLGLPSLSGMLALLSTRTGVPQAILLDNGYLTDVRTGAAGAVAARHLARQDIRTAGVIGAGAQGRYQMMALKLVRDYERLLVYDLSAESAARYQAEMSEALGVEVILADSVDSVVRESDSMATTTPSKQPYLKAEWLHPGLHITSMGSDAEDKNELYPDVLGRADLRVCDRKSQVFRLGEHHHALEAGVITEDSPIVELGEITAGQHPGRQGDSQISVCDLTGTGVQDTVIATLAYQKARAMGLGLEIEA
jgi:ectoine utilization protein EutC